MNAADLAIGEVDEREAGALAAVVRVAFADVAERFRLTNENCPTHPSLCQESWVRSDMAEGTRFFACRHDGGMLGCYGLAPAPHDSCRVQKLGVVPGWRGMGIGTRLLDDARVRTREGGGRMVEVGVLHDNQDLVSWYCRRGFELSGTARYPHLPFTVGFLFADV